MAWQARPEDVPALAAHEDDVSGFPDGVAGIPEDVPATAAHTDDVSGSSDGVAGTPEDFPATAAHTDDVAGFPRGMADMPDDVTLSVAFAGNRNRLHGWHGSHTMTWQTLGKTCSQKRWPATVYPCLPYKH
jgi:hypothetical protein